MIGVGIVEKKTKKVNVSFEKLWRIEIQFPFELREDARRVVVYQATIILEL